MMGRGGTGKSFLRSKLMKALQTKQCSFNNLVLLSLAFFFLGLMRGRGSPGLPEDFVEAEMEHNTARRSTMENRGKQQAILETAEGANATTYSPFDHGESGDAEVLQFKFQVLSWKPRIFYYPNFAPSEKCDSIIKLAQKSLAPSGLALKEGEKEEDNKDVRTSSGTFLSGKDDPSGALAWVEKKMSKLTAVPTNFGEEFNVLRYGTGQKYESHLDTFDPKDYGPQKTQRMASFLLYLSDVEEGGETMFPYEGGKRPNYGSSDCVGLRVKPKKGDAVLFWSLTANGDIDANALHGGCPVRKGEKWVATKWLRTAADE